jgi:hypothetical protein
LEKSSLINELTQPQQPLLTSAIVFTHNILVEMRLSTLISAIPLLVLSSAAPMDAVKRATSSFCPSYTIINTRSTGEPQGESADFRTMNQRIQAALSGGKIYNTVYPAGSNQDSEAGTTDIVNKTTSTLKTSPKECFILEGYSQGAQATVNAMSKLTGANFDAVKGVFLIGDPAHKAGLACNVDNNGGTTTRDVSGLSGRFGQGIPSNWVSQTLDVCIYVRSHLLPLLHHNFPTLALCRSIINILLKTHHQGDGVCDTTHGNGINRQHLQYPNDAPTQNLGTQYIAKALGGT